MRKKGAGVTRDKLKVIVVAGARPNFVKCAPILSALEKSGRFETTFIHTGQHYDYDMSDIFFRHLRLRKPDICLDVGSAPRAVQIERVSRRFEEAARKINPDIVIVVGDVNSTLGAAIAASMLKVKLAHVEAGLRSFDKSMPEEDNRVRTDALSDFLFTTSESAGDNLAREGVIGRKVHFVGNVMIDSLVSSLKEAERSCILSNLGLKKNGYYLLTLHRPSNVDRLKKFMGIIGAIGDIAERTGCRIVFPAHPRTQKAMEKLNTANALKDKDLFLIIKPLGYLDFLKLMRHSRMVLTDSGGIQEETSYLKVPCLTIRRNTERPVTVESGNNIIAGTEPEAILNSFEKLKSRFSAEKVKPIKFWDGRTASRIVRVLIDEAKR